MIAGKWTSLELTKFFKTGVPFDKQAFSTEAIPYAAPFHCRARHPKPKRPQPTNSMIAPRNRSTLVSAKIARGLQAGRM